MAGGWGLGVAGCSGPTASHVEQHKLCAVEQEHPEVSGLSVMLM